MEPVTAAIAAAVAGKTAEGLAEGAKSLLVKLRKTLRERFAAQDREALEAARDDPEDEAAVAELARRLDAAAEQDEELRGLLHRLGEHLQPRGEVRNTVVGNVSGGVTQVGGDVHGSINVGR